MPSKQRISHTALFTSTPCLKLLKKKINKKTPMLYSNRNSKRLSDLLRQHPDRIPVIVDRAAGSEATLGELRHRKFLVPGAITMGHLQHMIRAKLDLRPHQALILMVDSTIPLPSDTVADCYARPRAASPVLHITYACESAFGHRNE